MERSQTPDSGQRFHSNFTARGPCDLGPGTAPLGASVCSQGCWEIRRSGLCSAQRTRRVPGVFHGAVLPLLFLISNTFVSKKVGLSGNLSTRYILMNTPGFINAAVIKLSNHFILENVYCALPLLHTAHREQNKARSSSSAGTSSRGGDSVTVDNNNGPPYVSPSTSRSYLL